MHQGIQQQSGLALSAHLHLPLLPLCPAQSFYDNNIDVGMQASAVSNFYFKKVNILPFEIVSDGEDLTPTN